MKWILLPLNALRAFEAAGRLASFTQAAVELQVTHSAIGQDCSFLLVHRRWEALRRSAPIQSPVLSHTSLQEQVQDGVANLTVRFRKKSGPAQGRAKPVVGVRHASHIESSTSEIPLSRHRSITDP